MRFIPAVSPVRIQSPLPSTGETRERLAGHPLSKQRRPVGQVVKTRPFHGCNMGSSPVRVTTSAIRKRDCRINGGLAQLVRAPASHAGGHWFESSSLHQTAPDFVRNQVLFSFMPYHRRGIPSRCSPRKTDACRSAPAAQKACLRYVRFCCKMRKKDFHLFRSGGIPWPYTPRS